MTWREIDNESDPSESQQHGNESTADIAEIGRPSKPPKIAPQQSIARRELVAHGRRTRQIDTPYGTTIRAEQPHQPITRFGDVALDSTIRAAAQRQATAGKVAHLPLAISPTDLRRKVREAKVGNLILFVVDGSGSMGAQKRMTAVKGAIFGLLLDAYQKRDQVGMILFRGSGAQLILPPTNSIDLAQKRLAKIPTGGRTPLAQGLSQAAEVLQRYKQQAYEPLLVVVSDGRANVPMHGQNPLDEVITLAHQLAQQKTAAVVLDCETGRRKMGLAKPLARALNAQCIPLTDLETDLMRQHIQNTKI